MGIQKIAIRATEVQILALKYILSYPKKNSNLGLSIKRLG